MERQLLDMSYHQITEIMAALAASIQGKRQDVAFVWNVAPTQIRRLPGQPTKKDYALIISAPPPPFFPTPHSSILYPIFHILHSDFHSVFSPPAFSSTTSSAFVSLTASILSTPQHAIYCTVAWALQGQWSASKQRRLILCVHVHAEVHEPVSVASAGACTLCGGENISKSQQSKPHPHHPKAPQVMRRELLPLKGAA